MEGDPSKSRPGSSRLEDGSNSESAPSSPQERMDLRSLQEYILNFTEDEWIVFSCMLQTPMTRMQFAETCMAVLKVVSLSSIAVVLPAYVGVAKDVKSGRPTTPTTFSTIASTERPCRSLKTTSPGPLKIDGDVMDESESASSSSLELHSGPVGDLARMMKGILASLRKTVAWHPPAEDSACSVSERSASTKATTAVHGGAAHDQACITKILERLVASGHIHQIANNLVSQIQGAIQDSGPASTPVFDSVLSATVKVAPKRTLSASHVVHRYAEEAIKKLLQPYFLPLVAVNANDMTSTKTSSSSYASSRPHSATTKGTSPSLLGLELEKDECSCLMTKLMQRLPADISLRESAVSSRSNSAPHGRVTGSPSQRFSEVVDLFTRVMIFQVMEMVDTELKRHEQARLPSPNQEEIPIEGAVSTESDAGWYDGLFSGLIQRLLSEFLCTESVLGDDTPSSPRSLSTHSGTGRRESAPENLKKVLELFTRLMVSQVMDIIQVESSLSLGSRPCNSSVTFSILDSDAFTDGTSVVGADSSDNGCLVTALMLRLLVKLRDQSTASPDTVESSRELIGKILSEFRSATGTPDFQTYPNNVKLQTIYKAMDKFLLKEFGSETVLQRAVETRDESFDTILLSGLREELLPRCDVEVTAVPSPQSSSDGQTAMGRPRKWLKLKMPKLGRKKVSSRNTLSDFTGEHVESLPCHTPSVSTSGQTPRKRSFFRWMFTCCFKGSSEH